MASATNDTGVVPIRQAQAMQQDAVTCADDPTNAALLAVTEPAKVPSTEELFSNTFSTCNVALMFTLGLADPKFSGGSTKALSKWEMPDGSVQNLYNPFRKGGKPKGSDVQVPAGILRSALGTCMDTVTLMNASSILYLGSPKDVFSALNTALRRVSDVCTTSLSLAPDFVLGSFAVESSEAQVDAVPETENLTVSDIVRVTSWLSMDWREALANETPIVDHEAVIHFYVNNGSLYDSPDKLKGIRQVESVLRLMNAARGSSTDVLFSLNLSTASLVDAEMRDLLGVLLDTEGFELFTRQTLVDNFRRFEFTPKTKKAVSEDLFSPQAPAGDLFLVKILSSLEAPIRAPADNS